VSQRRLDQFASELSAEHKASGVDIVPLQCNVADEESVVNMVAGTVSKFGRIDYAVNAAGLAHVAKFAEFKTADVSER
jgi:NAD(P)-dependent dehydrogenase (short-subunit alcohol dehydrogenase family)